MAAVKSATKLQTGQTGQTMDLFAGGLLLRKELADKELADKELAHREFAQIAQADAANDTYADQHVASADFFRVVPATPGDSPGKDQSRKVDHLVAARRLQARLRRARSHSPEEVKAGRLICRHLLALLDEAQTAS